MKTKLSLLFVALISAVASLSAADFTVGGIAYTITSSTSPYTVAVSSTSTVYSGAVAIPANVTYSTVTYSVTSIGDNAFDGCSGLTSVTIPNSVTSIGYSAFGGCSGLASVTIPNSVISIGNYAFFDCSGLTSVTIPNSVTSIGASTFRYCSSLISVTIPNSVTSIGNWAFTDCSGLTSVTIPNSVTSIGYVAFGGCSGLINVDSSNPNYSSLDGVLFNKTQTNLIQCPISKSGNYIIPNSVTSIGDYTFAVCSGLTSVTIPNSVTSVGNDAFLFCSGLTSIYAGSAIPIDLSSSSEVFYNVDKTTCTLYVPVGSKSLYAAADQWKDFVNIVEVIPAGTEDKTVSSIALFPNPATTSFTLKGVEKETTLNVFDLSGKKVLETNVQPDEKISVANWSKGIYMVKVNEITTRLVVE